MSGGAVVPTGLKITVPGVGWFGLVGLPLFPVLTGVIGLNVGCPEIRGGLVAGFDCALTDEKTNGAG